MLTSTPPVASPLRTSSAGPKAVARPVINGTALARRRATYLQAALSDPPVAESVGADATGTAASMDGPIVQAKVPWYKKPCAFKDLTSVEELEAAVSPANNGGRMSVIDFYAGWCACCKSSFPTLCRIPNNELMASKFNFYKANIEDGDLAAYIKKKGVRGIPYVMVINSDGSDCIGMGASFKKMEVLRKNLDFIARAEKTDFVLDPNGLIMNR